MHDFDLLPHKIILILTQLIVNENKKSTFYVNKMPTTAECIQKDL